MQIEIIKASLKEIGINVNLDVRLTDGHGGEHILVDLHERVLDGLPGP